MLLTLYARSVPAALAPTRILQLARRKLSKPVFNEVGIQMLPERLRNQLFKSERTGKPKDDILRIYEDLHKRNCDLDRKVVQKPDVNLTLPDLKGGNLDEHLRLITAESFLPYFELGNELSSCSLPPS